MPKVGMEPIRRAQIMRAVIECIAEKGLEKLTIDAVAAQAKVSKGVVNYYFKGKQDLILQSFRAFLEMYNKRIEALITPSMNAMEMLEVVIEVTLNGPVQISTPQRNNQHELKSKAPFVERFELGLTLSTEALGKVYMHFISRVILDSDFKKIYGEVYKSFLEGIQLIIDYGIETGEFRKVDSKRAAYGMMALLEGAVSYLIMGFRPLTLKDSGDSIRDYARRFLRNKADKHE